MDEAIKEAFRSVHEKLDGHVRDFKAHTVEDRDAMQLVRDQIAEWSGQLTVIKWLSAAILAAILAYGGKHW